jgi:hypothetical protein
MPSLIGTKSNQVPTVGDLGTMAFREQDQFYSSQQTMGFKNRIINGAMVIDQRNAGASVSIAAGESPYALDRFRIGNITDGAVTINQDSSAPAGFVKSLKVTVTTQDSSLSSTQSFNCLHYIEGTNISDLGWGTANAQPVTVSFWVNSSVTGPLGGSLRNSASNRSYPFSYVINSANTWEYKTVTIAGDTSGTWLTNTEIGIQVNFCLGAGSDRSGTAGAWNSNNNTSATGATSVVGTNGATFYITGVQLEKGSTATSFDYRPYGTELNLCLRYFNRFGASSSDYAFGIGFRDATSTISLSNQMPVPLRATPSVSFNGTVYTIGGGQFLSLTSPTAIIMSVNNLIVRIKATTSATITNSNTSFSFYTGGIADYVDYNSEL